MGLTLFTLDQWAHSGQRGLDGRGHTHISPEPTDLACASKDRDEDIGAGGNLPVVGAVPASPLEVASMLVEASGRQPFSSKAITSPVRDSTKDVVR